MATVYGPSQLRGFSHRASARTFQAVSRADEAVYVDGVGWYSEAHRHAAAVGRLVGLSARHGAGIIAALSPQVGWERNLDDAYALVQGAASNFSAFGRNVVKAWRIAEGEDPAVVLGGRKVRAFFDNMARPDVSEAVTCDTWMARLWGLAPRAYERKGVYEACAAGVRRAADRLGLLPHQAQAVAWLIVRNGR